MSQYFCQYSVCCVHMFSPPQSQYFVKPPFATIIAASLLRFLHVSLAHLSTGIFALSLRKKKAPASSWMLTAILKSFHRFSVGLRSGLWIGHSNIPFKHSSLKHLSVVLAVCLGSFVWWPWISLNVSLWDSGTSYAQEFLSNDRNSSDSKGKSSFLGVLEVMRVLRLHPT